LMPIAVWPLVKQAASLALGQLMRAVSAWSSVTVVALVSTAAAAGAYGAAQRLSQLAAGFTALYFYGYLPLISRAVGEGPDAVRAFLGSSLRFASMVTIPLAVGMTVFAAPLTLVVFGHGYESAVPVLRIVVWTVPVAVISGHFRHALIAAHLTRLDLACVTTGAATTLALNAGFVRPFGLRGAALAAVAGEVVVAICAVTLAGRRVMMR
jgi:O-antigen/teichoic acid export membrane protein